MITEKQLNKKLKGLRLNTSGLGLWSRAARETKVKRIELDIRQPFDGDKYVPKSVNVYLTRKSWDVDKHGLVYTDPRWIKEFRAALRSVGFKGKVSYSEQGMQGDNYVNLDWS
jgi:hypothetical protein